MTDDDRNLDSPIMKGIRVFLIITIYNIIMAIIYHSTKYILQYYNFDFAKWGLSEWWVLISIYVLIGAIMLYSLPFFESSLHLRLKNVLLRLGEKVRLEHMEKTEKIKRKTWEHKAKVLEDKKMERSLNEEKFNTPTLKLDLE